MIIERRRQFFPLFPKSAPCSFRLHKIKRAGSGVREGGLEQGWSNKRSLSMVRVQVRKPRRLKPEGESSLCSAGCGIPASKGVDDVNRCRVGKPGDSVNQGDRGQMKRPIWLKVDFKTAMFMLRMSGICRHEEHVRCRAGRSSLLLRRDW